MRFTECRYGVVAISMKHGLITNGTWALNYTADWTIGVTRAASFLKIDNFLFGLNFGWVILYLFTLEIIPKYNGMTSM